MQSFNIGQKLRCRTSGETCEILSITGSWVELKNDKSKRKIFVSIYKVRKNYR